jgi:hypothetical protein
MERLTGLSQYRIEGTNEPHVLTASNVADISIDKGPLLRRFRHNG